MKKKVFAIMLTAALVATQSISVLANNSTSSDASSRNGSTGTTTSSTQTSDGQSLSSNGAGSKTENVKAEFAPSASATAGLPSQAVTAINSINTGAKLSEAVGNASLEGYSALTKTSAIVLKDAATGGTVDKAATVSLYIPNLLTNLQNVKILYFENATGQWKVVEPTSIDFANKTISFEMFGSGTVTVIHK